MNTENVMALADDYANWAVDKSKAHPSTVEVREALHTAIDALVEQAKWAHHTPALLTDADAAADLAGVPRPGAGPIAHLWQHGETGRTTVRMTDDEWFSAGTTWQYLGPLYAHPPQASQPLTQQEKQRLWNDAMYDNRSSTTDAAMEYGSAIEAAHGIGAQKGKP